jgi:hypothetical protein
VPLALWETLVLRVPLALQETLVLRVPPAIMERLVQPGTRAQPVPLEIRALRVPLEPPEPLDHAGTTRASARRIQRSIHAVLSASRQARLTKIK